MTNERLKMTVEMEVTEAQALALQAMFKCWNKLSSWGSSRMVAFYADGDGNFHPHCKFTFDRPIRELTEELELAACCAGDGQIEGKASKTPAHYAYDFDPIAWKINH
jgi:hypothetical protein